MINLRDLNLLKNKYLNKKIFVIGNGPSINQIDLEILDDYCTVGMNKIDLKYPDTTWRPDFYFYANSINHTFFPHVEENLIHSNFAIVDDSCMNYFDDVKPGLNTDVYYFKRINLFSDHSFRNLSHESIEKFSTEECEEYWSYDITSGVFHYHTFYSLFQILLYMGFTEIVLLGFDLGRSYRNPHIVYKSGLDPHRFDGNKIDYLMASIKNNFLKSLVNGISHQMLTKVLTFMPVRELFIFPQSENFDSRYLNDRIVYDGPNHDRQHIQGHIIANKVLSENDVKVINASASSKIEVYDKIELDNIV
jgi:hypothetical protein